jgi:hypothetical protein
MSAEGHDHGHDHEHEHHHKETFITKYIFSLTKWLPNNILLQVFSWEYRCRFVYARMHYLARAVF